LTHLAIESMMESMSARFEGSFFAKDKLEIFFQLWATEQPRGTIVITHGLAEHGECYHGVAKTVLLDQWETYAWDMRGHGHSEGKRGHVSDFNNYVSDLKQLVTMIAKERKAPNSPLILFGHSMGGLITTLLALEWGADCPINGLVLSSPLFGLALPVPWIKEKVARLAAQWLPSITLHNEIRYKDLSRDEAMLKTYPIDTLRHDKISPEVYLGMMRGMDRVRKSAGQLNLPVLMQVAGRDPIVNARAEQEIFQLLPHRRKVLEIYPESLHEIYNDLDREQAFADLRKFLHPFAVNT
jgi:alpha-beta hydrolase superfamily lysophospholipase